MAKQPEDYICERTETQKGGMLLVAVVSVAPGVRKLDWNRIWAVATHPEKWGGVGPDGNPPPPPPPPYPYGTRTKEFVIRLESRAG